MYNLGCLYRFGMHGLPQDHSKALELWHRSQNLAMHQHSIVLVVLIIFVEVVELDEKKALHYIELAAMGGFADARHNRRAYE